MKYAKKQNEYDVSGKKILIVGASGHHTAAIESANEMGVQTLAINYSPSAIGKKHANKSADVDTYIPEDVLEYAKREGIDGLFASWNEVTLFTTAWVADKLGMPFYATRSQLDALVKKDDFKNTCKKYGVPIVPEYYVGANLTEEEAAKLVYPVIVKPTYSGGTRGMTILYDSEKIFEACEKAKTASEAGEYVIEKYLKDTKLIVIDFAVQDGEAYIVSVADRITVRESEDRVPLGFCFMYPSEYIDIVEEQALESLKRLISGLKIENGIISFEGMISDGKLYIIETQFRFGGTHIDKHIVLETGVDLMQMMIELSLVGKFDSWKLSDTMNPRFNRVYSTQNVQLYPGTIKKIENLDKVLSYPEVTWFLQLKDIGDTAPDDGSTARNFAKIGLVGDSRTDLYKVIDTIQKELKIYDENDNNMVIQNVPNSLLV